METCIYVPNIKPLLAQKSYYVLDVFSRFSGIFCRKFINTLYLVICTHYALVSPVVQILRAEFIKLFCKLQRDKLSCYDVSYRKHAVMRPQYRYLYTVIHFVLYNIYYLVAQNLLDLC